MRGRGGLATPVDVRPTTRRRQRAGTPRPSTARTAISSDGAPQSSGCFRCACGTRCANAPSVASRVDAEARGQQAPTSRARTRVARRPSRTKQRSPTWKTSASRCSTASDASAPNRRLHRDHTHLRSPEVWLRPGGNWSTPRETVRRLGTGIKPPLPGLAEHAPAAGWTQRPPDPISRATSTTARPRRRSPWGTPRARADVLLGLGRGRPLRQDRGAARRRRVGYRRSQRDRIEINAEQIVGALTTSLKGRERR